ncbi:flavin reductase family protein [Roseovarius salinarum]|uniref:flavin reductase family protein n=1 Tax=Roseovarius salinarum TaxID=1981892 RepID=UPI001E32452B|nr:flavin reductase family protein [Roseovarius salinarum]
MSHDFDDGTATVARERFITAMRGVAASVTVVTTDGPEGRHGATVSAFSSVSADPPTVLICLNARSRIAQAVSGNGIFCVNVLPHESFEVADRFAGRHDARVSDRFAGIRHQTHDGTAPRIDGATVFNCRLDQTVPSGTHLVLIGHVIDVLDGQVDPLTYRDGSYHRVIPRDFETRAAPPGRSVN